MLGVVAQLDEVAAGLGVKLSQLALAWVLRQPGVSSALIGASKPEQVEENARAVEIALAPDTLETIDRILGQVADFAPAR
ncbi:L-glyceraldehyde 3-phosphate reductase [compost metagenome]